jgi:hypothetical protein
MLTKTSIKTTDLSTRTKRIRVISLITELLRRVKDAEETSLNKIPINLQNGEGYIAGENAVESFDEVIDILEDTYVY